MRNFVSCHIITTFRRGNFIIQGLRTLQCGIYSSVTIKTSQLCRHRNIKIAASGILCRIWPNTLESGLSRSHGKFSHLYEEAPAWVRTGRVSIVSSAAGKPRYNVFAPSNFQTTSKMRKQTLQSEVARRFVSAAELKEDSVKSASISLTIFRENREVFQSRLLKI